MGLYEDWKAAHPDVNVKSPVNIEFFLKQLSEGAIKEILFDQERTSGWKALWVGNRSTTGTFSLTLPIDTYPEATELMVTFRHQGSSPYPANSIIMPLKATGTDGVVRQLLVPGTGTIPTTTTDGTWNEFVLISSTAQMLRFKVESMSTINLTNFGGGGGGYVTGVYVKVP